MNGARNIFFLHPTGLSCITPGMCTPYFGDDWSKYCLKRLSNSSLSPAASSSALWQSLQVYQFSLMNHASWVLHIHWSPSQRVQQIQFSNSQGAFALRSFRHFKKIISRSKAFIISHLRSHINKTLASKRIKLEIVFYLNLNYLSSQTDGNIFLWPEMMLSQITNFLI